MKRSPYVIQGVRAMVRGLTKLKHEGEPPGDHRQAPEPPDRLGQGLESEGQ
jgi:hypothetical protein